MNDSDKLIWLFHQVHGELSISCTLEIVYDEDYTPIGVDVMKNGEVCWSKTKTDLVFDYVTKHLD